MQKIKTQEQANLLWFILNVRITSENKVQENSKTPYPLGYYYFCIEKR